MLRPPLTGEPLPVDLINTRWRSGDGYQDVLDDPPSTAAWLATWELPCEPGDLAAVTARLVEARTALAAHVASPSDPDAARAVSDLLDAGRLRLVLDADGPRQEADVPDAARRPAWEALRRYADLLAQRPGRMRRCAGSGCVLHFVDTSPRNARRWCSMEGCGNRAKARRHYERVTGASA